MLTSRWPARCSAAIALAALSAFHAAAGIRGVRIGGMWDEGYQAEGLRNSLDRLELMPNGYYYGGLYFAPGYSLLAPTFLTRLPAMIQEISDAPSRPFTPELYPSIVAAQSAAREKLDSPSFVENARSVFVVVSALSVAWVFFASHAATGSIWIALAAAALLACSWELSYHGRWVASDAMLGQFAALLFACSTRALGAVSAENERRWQRLSAIALGLALGAKLPAVFLSVPLAGTVIGSHHVGSVRARLLRLIELALIAGATFIVTSPGVLLDPLHFADDLLRVQSDYNRISTNYWYAEPAPLRQLGWIAAYFATAVFSPYAPIAIPFAGLALFGALIAVRERRAKLLNVLAFLLVYCAFVSLQKLLVVRNLMMTLPALAILAGAGLERVLVLAARVRWLPQLVTAAVVLSLSLNAAWLWRTASTIGTTSDASVADEAASYVDERQGGKFYIDPAVAAAFERVRPTGYRTPSVPFEEARSVVVYADQIPRPKANRPSSTRYFTSPIANYDYYPTLMGWFELKSPGRPILVMTKDRAEKFGFPRP